MERANIIKPEYVPVSKLWGKEATDFTPWLAGNIDHLGDALDMELAVETTEARQADDFRADILARDMLGNLVVIENQYGATDHKHLGQLLVYLTTLDARAAIWICETARQSHIDAVDWLNQNAPDGTGFYIVQLKVLKTPEAHVPIFEVIAKPSEESRAIGAARKDLSGASAQHVRFWTKFLDHARGTTSLFKNATSSNRSYIFIRPFKTSGVLLGCVALQRGDARVDIYIHTGSRERNKAIFDGLHQQRAVIEGRLDTSMTTWHDVDLAWQRLDDRDACRIHFTRAGIDYSDEAAWPVVFNFFLDASTALLDTFKDTLDTLALA